MSWKFLTCHCIGWRMTVFLNNYSCCLEYDVMSSNSKNPHQVRTCSCCPPACWRCLLSSFCCFSSRGACGWVELLVLEAATWPRLPPPASRREGRAKEVSSQLLETLGMRRSGRLCPGSATPSTRSCHVWMESWMLCLWASWRRNWLHWISPQCKSYPPLYTCRAVRQIHCEGIQSITDLDQAHLLVQVLSVVATH